MPVYVFECAKCPKTFERFLKVEERDNPQTCPSCGVENAQRLITPFQTNEWSSFLDKMERRISPEKFK